MKKLIYCIILLFTTLILSTEVSVAQSEKKFEYVYVLFDPKKIVVVYPDGKIEEEKPIVLTGATFNEFVISRSKLLNKLGEKGYKMVGTDGAQYIFMKEIQ